MIDVPGADPKLLLMAVVSVYERYQESDRKPGSDDWLCWPGKKQAIIAEIIDEWAVIGNGDKSRFPFSDGYVVALWIKWRKANDQDKRETVKDLELRRGLLPV